MEILEKITDDFLRFDYGPVILREKGWRKAM